MRITFVSTVFHTVLIGITTAVRTHVSRVRHEFVQQCIRFFKTILKYLILSKVLADGNLHAKKSSKCSTFKTVSVQSHGDVG